jgi:type IV pilus assembly protein PilQ
MKKYTLPFLWIWIVMIFFLHGIIVCQNKDEKNLENGQREQAEEAGWDNFIDNLDFKNTDIRDVIRLIATKYNLNIFIDNNISIPVTIHLSNIKIIDAIKFIVDHYDLQLEQMGNILKIQPKEIIPPPPKEIIVSYKDDRLTVDFNNEQIDKAMYAISQKSGKTIILDKFVSGKINGYLNDVPFEIGLQQLLENNGYSLEKKQGIYNVHMQKDAYAGQEGMAIRSRGSFYLQVEDSLISMDVQNAPLNDLVQEAGRKLNKNIFLYGEIKGTISARVDRLTFDEFLDYIFQGSDVTYKNDKSVYLVGDKNVKGLSSAELIKLNYIKSENIDKLLPPELMEKAGYRLITEQNGIMVVGTKDSIKKIREYVEKIDRPSPQILIEALVIDFNTSKLRDISVNASWNNTTDDSSGKRVDNLLPGIDILFRPDLVNSVIDKVGNFLGFSKIGKLPDNFFLQLNALESQGAAHVRSKPQIATLNGYPAEISIGQTQYYKLKSRTPYGYGYDFTSQQQQQQNYSPYISETERFHEIKANISLKITPWVSASGEITTEIEPDFETPIGTFSAEVLPTIQTRKLISTVRLKDGETIVLGGLIQTTVDKKEEGVPYIRKIPLIGNLFQNTSYNQSTSELIIYVTPHLYYFNE